MQADVKHTSESNNRPRRRRYQSPRIIQKETVEAVAAVCNTPGGKSDPTCIVGFS